MSTLAYKNINDNFTFENINTQLIKFWINEVVTSNYSKIWLSIIIVKNNNRSLALIKNLPFNTYEYSDVVIVLKQNLGYKRSINKDIFKSITFKFSFEKPKHIYNWNVIKRMIIKIILLLITLCIIALLYYLFFEWYSNLNLEIINVNKFPSNAGSIAKEITYAKPCIWSPFIELFNISNQWSYKPSYFIPTRLEAKIYDFNLLEYIIHNQYAILDYYTRDSMRYITELSNILEQYKKITKILE